MREPQEIAFLSSDGKTTVKASIWTPEEKETRGVVQICHGMVEHIRRYDEFAQELCARGFAVCGDDHLGHGRTAGSAENFGYFGEKDGWKRLVEDEDRMRREIQARFPALPYFLLGHSMGSFITRNYITRYADGLSGYICCGTSGPNPLNGVGILLSRLMVRFCGGRSRGDFLNKLAFKEYNSRYGEVKTGHEWLSRDASSYEGVDDDPATSFVFTNAGFRDLFQLLYSVTGRKWSEKIPADLPILFLSGDMDPVGQFGKGVRKVYTLVKDSGVRDVTLKLYPGARHELHHETNKDEFLEDVVAWMEKHMEEGR